MKRRWWLISCLVALVVAINALPQVFDLKQARCFLRSHEEKQSELLHAWLAAGDAAMDVGRWKRGVPLRRPEVKDPKAELSRTLAPACGHSKEDRQFLAQAKRATDTDGKFVHPNFRVALPGAYERYAMTFFERARSIDPANPDARRGLEEAVVALPQAIRGQVRGWPILRHPNEQAQTVEEVIAAFKALESNPEKTQELVQWLLLDATAAVKEHDYRHAARKLALVLQSDPGNREADQALSVLPSLALKAARHYAQAGRYDDAEGFLEDALYLQPDNPDAGEVRQWMEQQRAKVEKVRREMDALSPKKSD